MGEEKNVYLPAVDGDGMQFVRFEEGCRMVEGEYRILVPSGTQRVAAGEIDLLILPGVAFDPWGRRLGKGKGYYDRFMEQTGAYRMGVCLDHQIVREVPAEPHDKTVDMVVTPHGVFDARNATPETTSDDLPCIPLSAIQISGSPA